MVVKEPDWPKNKCVALMTKLAKMYADGKVNTKEEIYTQRDFLKSTESSVFWEVPGSLNPFQKVHGWIEWRCNRLENYQRKAEKHKGMATQQSRNQHSLKT